MWPFKWKPPKPSVYRLCSGWNTVATRTGKIIPIHHPLPPWTETRAEYKRVKKKYYSAPMNLTRHRVSNDPEVRAYGILYGCEADIHIGGPAMHPYDEWFMRTVMSPRIPTPRWMREYLDRERPCS